MKKKHWVISIILGSVFIIASAGVLLSDVFWGHIPIVDHSHTTSNCYGYAQGRAFGKSAGDLECDPVHTFISGIKTEYFPVVTDDPTFSGIQRGNIIVFEQSHAAYVASVPSPFNLNDVTVDQVPNVDRPEQTGIRVGDLRVPYGNPIAYHRLSGGGGTAKITFINSFGSGIIYAGDAESENWQTRESGVSYDYFVGSGLDIMAVDTQHNTAGIRQRFQYWEDNQGAPNPRTIQISTNTTYHLNFENEFDVRFQNSLPGASGGQINVRGATVSSPYDTQVREETEQSITGEALYQVINRIEYTFSSWSTGSTTASTTFTPTSNVTYTANFTAKPLQAENVYAGGTVGNPVQITWTDHPHAGVSYKIYRRVKPLGGSTGPEQLIASLNHGTTSYTDYDYNVTSTYSNSLLSYDVRSYFSPNGTYSDPNFVQVFGTETKIADGANHQAILLSELPQSYAISSFPNPFNPSTTISYQLVEDANVQLRIYDVMGREVMTLVDAQKTAGYHSVQWNGKDGRETQVSSGMYLYRFTANPSNGAKPYVASGKLLLMK